MTNKIEQINNNLNIAANLSQFYSLFLLLRDASNNQIMEELQRQNKEYLTKIIEQNEEIIKLLKPKKVFYDKDEKIDVLTYLERKIENDSKNR